MRNVIRSLILASLTGAAVFPAAATPGDFYLGLLRRGVSAYEAARYEEAKRQLGIAAFGFVESVPQYETAEVYLALTFGKLGDHEHAREAIRRVISAERVDRRFAQLPLPLATREAFDSLASQWLTPAEIAALSGDTSTRSPATAEPAATTKASKPEARAASPPPAVPSKATADSVKKEAGARPPASQPSPQHPSSPTVASSPDPVQTKPQAVAVSSVPPPSATVSSPAAPPPTTRAPETSAAAKPAAKVTEAAPPRTSPSKTPQKSAIDPKDKRTSTPAAAAPAPAMATVDVDQTLAAAALALRERRLRDAQYSYHELLGISLSRSALLQVTEGLYRSRDFPGVLAGFERLAPLHAGEEPYRFYQAVALYETGNFDAAKRELNTALAFIAITPDVARYRAKIEAAK